MMRTAARLAGIVLRARGVGAGMMQTLITQGAVMLVNVATGILTARLLGPTGRGELGAAFLWFLLPAALATVGLQNGIVYETRRRPGRAAATGVVSLGCATLLFIPLALGCLWALPHLMRGYTASGLALARFAILTSVFNVWMVLLRQSLLGTGNMLFFNLSNYFSPLLYLLLLLVLFATSRITPFNVMAAQVAATIMVLVPTGFVAIRAWRKLPAFVLASAAPLLAYSLKASPIDLVMVGYYNIDRVFLVALVSPTEFGFYTVAASLARLLGILQTAVSSVTLAGMSHRPVREIEIFIHQTFRILFWLLAAGCIVGWLLGGELMRVFYGAKFGSAAPVFRVLIVDASAACLAQMQLEAFLAAGRPSYPSIVQAVSFAVIIGLMLMLAPSLGALGAALSLLGGSLTKLVLLLMGLRSIGLALPSLRIRVRDFEPLRRLLRHEDRQSTGQPS